MTGCCENRGCSGARRHFLDGYEGSMEVVVKV